MLPVPPTTATKQEALVRARGRCLEEKGIDPRLTIGQPVAQKAQVASSDASATTG